MLVCVAVQVLVCATHRGQLLGCFGKPAGRSACTVLQGLVGARPLSPSATATAAPGTGY